MNGPEILIPLTLFGGGFATIFGVVYLKTRQNMAMIEKGMDPKIKVASPRPYSAPFQNLKWGLLLVGSGVGLLLAYLMDILYLRKIAYDEFHDYQPEVNIPIYFALIAIFGGLGLIISYRIEKKEWQK